MDPLKHGLQRFEIRVDICNDGNMHGTPAGTQFVTVP
jgi:hypothetical protein